MIATLVDTKALWQTLWTSALAGLSVTIVFAIAVLGATRAQDARRAGRPLAIGLFSVLALLGLAATMAVVVYAITVITTK